MRYMERFFSEFGTWNFSGDVAYFKLAFLAYAAAFLIYLVHLFTRDKSSARAATVVLIIGLCLHTASIAVRAVHAGELPSISLYEMISTTVWGILCLYLITQLSSRITTFGAFVLPIALAMMVYAMFLTKSFREVPPVLKSFWLYVHVPISVVAYGALAVVFALAFAYLFRDGRDNLVWIGIGAVAILIAFAVVVGNRSRQMKPPIWIEGESFVSGEGAEIDHTGSASGKAALGGEWGSHEGQSAVWEFRLSKPLPRAALSLVYERAEETPGLFDVIVDSGSKEMSPTIALSHYAHGASASEWEVGGVEIGDLEPGYHTIELTAAQEDSRAKIDALVVSSVDDIPMSVSHLEMFKKPSMLGAAWAFGILGLIPLAIGLAMTRRGAAVGEAKRGRFWLDRLPSLGEMERIMSRLIALGFIALTLVIITGAIWAADAWGRPWGWDPKEVASLIPWLFYAVYLHARHIAGWRGLGSVIFLFFGYIGVIFCLILVNLLPSGLHGYAG